MFVFVFLPQEDYVDMICYMFIGLSDCTIIVDIKKSASCITVSRAYIEKNALWFLTLSGLNK